MLSTRTVANHLVAAYDRLGVNDRAALAVLLEPVAPKMSVSIDEINAQSMRRVH